MNRRKLNPHILGFVMLTTFLMLVFVVCIVNAATKSGVGPAPNLDSVSYTINVWNLNYNNVTKITSSEHSFSLSNGEAQTINYNYEYQHCILNQPYENKYLSDPLTLPASGVANGYRKQTMSVFGLQQGFDYTLSAYTRVAFSRGGQGGGDTVTETLNFRR